MRRRQKSRGHTCPVSGTRCVSTRMTKLQHPSVPGIDDWGSLTLRHRSQLWAERFRCASATRRCDRLDASGPPDRLPRPGAGWSAPWDPLSNGIMSPCSLPCVGGWRKGEEASKPWLRTLNVDIVDWVARPGTNVTEFLACCTKVPRTHSDLPILSLGIRRKLASLAGHGPN